MRLEFPVAYKARVTTRRSKDSRLSMFLEIADIDVPVLAPGTLQPVLTARDTEGVDEVFTADGRFYRNIKHGRRVDQYGASIPVTALHRSNPRDWAAALASEMGLTPSHDEWDLTFQWLTDRANSAGAEPRNVKQWHWSDRDRCLRRAETLAAKLVVENGILYMDCAEPKLVCSMRGQWAVFCGEPNIEERWSAVSTSSIDIPGLCDLHSPLEVGDLIDECDGMGLHPSFGAFLRSIVIHDPDVLTFDPVENMARRIAEYAVRHTGRHLARVARPIAERWMDLRDDIASSEPWSAGRQAEMVERSVGILVDGRLEDSLRSSKVVEAASLWRAASAGQRKEYLPGPHRPLSRDRGQ